MPNTANTAGGRYSHCIEKRQWGTNCMLVRSVIPRWVAEQTHSHCRCITSVYIHRPARPYISSRYARTMALIRDCCWCGYYRVETEGWLVRAGNDGSTGRRLVLLADADSVGSTTGHPRFPITFSSAPSPPPPCHSYFSHIYNDVYTHIYLQRCCIEKYLPTFFTSEFITRSFSLSETSEG